MSNKPFRVGIVGLQPGQSWASFAHLPAIEAQKDRFQAIAVANSRYESSLAAAKAAGIPKAFENADALVKAEDVDIVAVTVRVPVHREVVIKALNAGKTIYCEWPLAKDLAEAEELASLAKEKNVRTFIGTQALGSPAIWHLKTLMNERHIGEVLSHSLIGYGRIWGPEISDEAEEGYLLDKENGATMLTIPVAHTLAAVQDVFGKINEVTSVIATRRKKIYSKERDGFVDMTAPDQVGVQAVLADGSIFSLHYRGGLAPDGNGFTWEINGTKGVIRITGLTGSIQIEELKIESCLEGTTQFKAVEIPAETLQLFPQQYVPGNVARMYRLMSEDLINNTHKAPDFDYAVELHRLIDRIEKASILKN
jgi:predicted dehydrogenase